MMCLRKPRKPLVLQLKRQAAASPGKHQLPSEMPAALARARSTSTSSSPPSPRPVPPLHGWVFSYRTHQKRSALPTPV